MLSVPLLATAATSFVHAEGPLPPLVLTNRADDCDHIIPNAPNPNCPPCEGPSPYLVPPLYLPAQPAGRPQATPAPTPASAPPAEAPPVESNPADAEPLPPSAQDSERTAPTDSDTLFSDERAQRLDKLGSLLNELHKRLRDGARSAEDDARPESTEAPPLTPESETPDDATPSNEQNPAAPPLPSESSVPPPLSSQGLPPAEPALVPPPSESSFDGPEPVSVAAPSTRRDASLAWIHETAVDHPVDRLALADNLYAAGETALALSVYAEIDVTTLDSADSNWVAFQLAGCYRRLGQVEEASRRYRELVSIEGPAWMVDLARWWLMALDKRAAMTRDSNQLDATLQLLKEQVGNEIKPGT